MDPKLEALHENESSFALYQIILSTFACFSAEQIIAGLESSLHLKQGQSGINRRYYIMHTIVNALVVCILLRQLPCYCSALVET